MDKLRVGQRCWMPRSNPQHPEMNKAEELLVISDDGGDRVCCLMRQDDRLSSILGPAETVEFIPREFIYTDKSECLGPGMQAAMKLVLELQAQGKVPMCDCDLHKRN